MMRKHLRVAGVVFGLAVAALALAVAWEIQADVLPLTTDGAEPDRSLVERGAYLAKAGNCLACHTARGGKPFAGGRAIDTPFGTVYAGNLTPDAATGLGQWSATAFRRALHEGRSRDGHMLYPVFPYTHTTLVSDEDSDALHAFLRSVPPVEQVNREHGLRWPVSTQAALAAWRLLYFKPGRFQPQTEQSVEWNRGAYLARGLAHCSACHSSRDALGGGLLGGGVWGASAMPDGHWLAPSLRDARQGGVSSWTVDQVTELLLHGRNDQASTMGPMAEVVFEGTQHLLREDVMAMAVFLKDLPTQADPAPAFVRAKAEQMELGKRLYGPHCADCHGPAGQGSAGAYPPLAGNRAVVMDSHINAVQAILSGGFSPATAAVPQPYGMPPFRTLLTDAELAAVASFVRQSWGNKASAVSPLDVQRLR
jgi:mono/diheme cytochrome c family protein